ncbi:hypothetical protein LguiA_022820 [Lonicera macranthoides]
MSCLESTSMSELPAHILFDIFSRLPPNTIGHCRCVSKTWCNVLLDPHFVNLHLSKSPSCLMINEYKGQQSTTLKLFEIDDEPDHLRVHREPAITLQHGVGEKLYLQGSINGLLCLWQFDDNDDTYIFNPILREYVLLPKQKHVRKSQAYVSYGFGFSPITSQYKVVRIFQGNVPCNPPSELSSYVSECEVYTLGTHTWRSVGHVPFSTGDGGILVNGGLHWLKIEIPQMIARFDLETESFQMICSTPPLNRETLYLNALVELGGCLCISDNSLESELVIWKMKEYGLTESWTKEIVISRNYIPDWVVYEGVCPVRIFKDGSILMLWRDDRLFTYCPRTKAFEELDIGMSNYDTCYEAVNYVPSIVSLKNIISGKVLVF